VAWVMIRRPEPVASARVLFAALFVATTPVQPWYAAGLVAFAALAGSPWVMAVTLAGYPYFFAVILDYRHVVAAGRVSYGAAAAAVVAAWALGSRRRHLAQVDRPAAVEAAVPARPVPGREDGPGGPARVPERLESPR
jgi:hypothetical protein